MQRYVDRPLLVGGRKFHLRAYVLAVGALSAYLYSDVLTLFSLKPYAPHDLADTAAHITNTCCQAVGGEEDEARAVGLLRLLPERLAAEGALPLSDARERCGDALRQMRDVLGGVFAAVAAELSFQPLPNAFELFGMDFLLDADWRVWFLEANAEPDFARTGGALRRVVDGVVEGALRLSVDAWRPEAAAAAGAASEGEWLPVFTRADPKAAGGGASMKLV